MQRRAISVQLENGPEQSVCWYDDADSGAIRDTISCALGLPRHQRFFLVDRADQQIVVPSAQMPSVDYIVKLVLDVDNRTTGVKLKPGLQFCQSKENCCPQQSERQRKRLKMLSSPLSEVQGPSAGDQAMPDPFVQELKNSQDNEDDELQELSKDEISMGDEKASNKLSALPYELQKGAWTLVETTGQAPSPRWGQAAAMTQNGLVMIYGGQNDKELFSDVAIFSPETKMWTRAENSDGIARSWATAVAIPNSDQVFVFGGECASGEGIESVHAVTNPMLFDSEIMLWYPATIYGKMPKARSGHSASLVGDKIVIFGGMAGRHFLHDVHVLYYEKWTWLKPRTGGEDPGPRAYHTATTMGSRIIVFGGTDRKSCLHEVWVLDTDTWVWEKPMMLGDHPPARCAHSVMVLDDTRIMIFGGWDASAKTEIMFNDVYILDTASFVWTKVEEPVGDFPGYRASQSVVAVRDDVQFVFGGRGSDGETFHDDVFFYSQ